MLNDDALAPLMALAERLADAAGRAALPWFRHAGLEAENKAGAGGYDPVTAADRAAEDAMREILARERPEDGILGEESDSIAGRSGLTWVLDPIDGTRSFMSGLPSWGVLVGLDDGHDWRLGVVDQPHVGERFLGILGEGGGEARVRHRGTERRISVRTCTGLPEAVLLTTSPDLFAGTEAEAFQRLRHAVRLARYGTDCYGYAMVAAGQADLVVESGLAAYDIAAPGALVRAAGGIVTDWRGGDCRWGGRVVAAGDRRVHAAALEVLSAVP